MASKGTSRSSAGTKPFAPPRGFDGRIEDWEDFSYKLKAYLSLQEPDFGDCMDKIETSADPVVDEDKFFWTRLEDGSNIVSERTMGMSRTLQYTLIMLCSGPALTIVKTAHTQNGFETWRLLSQRYAPRPMSKQYATLGHILRPSFGTNFLDDFQNWESGIADYERDSGTILPDSVKISILQIETSGQAQQSLRCC